MTKATDVIAHRFEITPMQWPPKVVKIWCLDDPVEHGLIYHAGNFLYFLQVKPM